MKKEKPIPSVEITDKDLRPQTKKLVGKKFIRSCMKCFKNFYSPGDYSEHMKSAHGKSIPKNAGEARKVDSKLSSNDFDVPEEILVKSARKKSEEKKKVDKVAESRRGRQPAEKKIEPVTTPRRTRRTKVQIEADKKKGK